MYSSGKACISEGQVYPPTCWVVGAQMDMLLEVSFEQQWKLGVGGVDALEGAS